MTDSTASRVADPAGSVSASALVTARLKQLRKARGMSAPQLAERCAELGWPGMSTNVIANIESRRRDVSVDELLVLALALDVAPIHLLSPVPPEPVSLAVTQTVVFNDSTMLCQWLRGEHAPPQTHRRRYYAEAVSFLPAADSGQTMTQYAHTVLQDGAKRLVSQYEESAVRFVDDVRRQVVDMLGELEYAVTEGVESADLLRVLGEVKGKLATVGHQSGTKAEL